MKYSIDNLDKLSVIRINTEQFTSELCTCIEEAAMNLMDEKQVADIILDASKVKVFCNETGEMLRMIHLSTTHLNGMFALVSTVAVPGEKITGLRIFESSDEAMDTIFENQLQRHVIEEENFDLEDFDDELEL